MKHVFEIGLGAMISIPSFMKIGLGIQKLIRGIHRYTGSIEMASVYFGKAG
jgi:hypothetical protein